MSKNKDIEIEITGVTSEGNGVGRHNGVAVFVTSVAKGDLAVVRPEKTNKNYIFANSIKIIKPSPDRITPECDSFQKCGGCVFQHINYEAECEIKSGFVRDAFKRIGGMDVCLTPIIAGESRFYRNKAQYPISADGRAGFFAKRSHKIIPCDECLLQPKEFTLIKKAVELFIKQYAISVYNEKTGKGLVRHLYIRSSSLGEIMVVLVINGENLPHAKALFDILSSFLGERLKSLMININRKKTNVILGEECRVLFGDGYINDELCGVRLRVSPLSFAQVNHDMAEKLYMKAAEYAQPEGKTVIDLYCGTGAIGLSIAKRAKSVIGVEIVPQAIEDAEYNAELNGIKNTRFICADAATAASQLRDEGVTADVIIVDPPRKGCDRELLQIISEDFAPERIVYVSCDPATLARDCRILDSLGYRVEKATPVDLFPRTAHVECVASLVRNTSI